MIVDIVSDDALREPKLGLGGAGGRGAVAAGKAEAPVVPCLGGSTVKRFLQ
jgi:hypothetical protein